ncbi:probable ribose-5-phosphate isomerase 3, chloroplastic [Malania oleifera]|uniref:probable ribose-5-phosphate isomerase 3, chloroplastic n=1 Tax=Malania oleifera TaxID=397392 RepID=UPI0025AE924B|nr:probable ribose-5-phosphate isomerase 3, chloroplastic [Malania oleifera]XP_057960431.1 probable ribose-5-phosphate isomerase 3, chloroplastic [Malania oleifera]XP_057960432.1 probable ribose-5-phosphate isomerase 3, chloroplastic [Malania oleifera]
MATLSLSSPPSLSSTRRGNRHRPHHRSATHLILRTPTHVHSHSRSRTTPIKALSAPSPSPPPLTQDGLKKLAADEAVSYVSSGMVLGLGTGSTAAFVVAKIGELLKSGQLTDIVGIPTSKRTEDQARSLGIPLSGLDDNPRLDLAIDGADEVDPYLNLVKGRGGALLREKMVEAASEKFVVVADDSKLVQGLGGSGLAMPVEVVQFCWKYNLVKLQELFKEEGCEAKLRLGGDGKPYVTDNWNYIVDLYFKTPIRDAEAAAKEISAFEGVVEHGLFLNMATAVIIAGKDGVSVTNKFRAG